MAVCKRTLLKAHHHQNSLSVDLVLLVSLLSIVLPFPIQLVKATTTTSHTLDYRDSIINVKSKSGVNISNYESSSVNNGEQNVRGKDETMSVTNKNALVSDTDFVTELYKTHHNFDPQAINKLHNFSETTAQNNNNNKTEEDDLVKGVIKTNSSVSSKNVNTNKDKDRNIKTIKSKGQDEDKEEEETLTFLVLRLAHCRANCLSKKNEKLKKRQKYSTYFKKIDVFASTLKEQINLSFNECWDTCLVLEIENGGNQPSKLVDVVCSSNNSSCLSGCQEACEHFHRDQEQHTREKGSKPPLLAAVEPFLSYNISTITNSNSNNINKSTNKGSSTSTSTSTSTSKSASASTSTMKKQRLFQQLDLSWPESEGSVVYSIVQHVRLKNSRLGWTWRLLEQTTVGKISLTFSEKPKIGDIRVLAADPFNLVHVFSQEKVDKKTPTSTSKSQSQSHSQSQSQSNSNSYSNSNSKTISNTNFDSKSKSNSNSSSSSTTSTNSSTIGYVNIERGEEEQGVLIKGKNSEDSWHLRTQSMVHQKFLVVTEITWDLPENKKSLGDTTPQTIVNNNSGSKQGGKKESEDMSLSEEEKGEEEEDGERERSTHLVHSSTSSFSEISKRRRHNFLLTWEVSGLKGNMVTDSNTVSISLLPDTIYSIQVGLIDEDHVSSEKKEPQNPWEFESELKVTIKSSFLSVNTSEAVYINGNGPTGTETDTEADEKPESDIKSVQNQNRLVGTRFRNIDNDNGDDDEHEEKENVNEDEEGEEEHPESVDSISSFAHTDSKSHAKGIQDNDHIRTLTESSSSSSWSWKCQELPSGVSKSSKWLCQLSMSWLVILCSVYSVLFILSMTVYLFFAFKHYPYCTCRCRLSDYVKRSTCKRALLEEDFNTRHFSSSSSDSVHDFHDDDSKRTTMDHLSQYNIV